MAHFKFVSNIRGNQIMSCDLGDGRVLAFNGDPVELTEEEFQTYSNIVGLERVAVTNPEKEEPTPQVVYKATPPVAPATDRA